MFIRCLRLACVLAVSAVNVANACELAPGSSWNWSVQQLVERADWIWRASVVAETPSANRETSTYMFGSLKLIQAPSGVKLDHPRDIILEELLPANASAKSGRFSKDCKHQLSFEVGKEYLLFLDNGNPRRLVFHPKAAEPLSGDHDLWLKKISFLAHFTCQRDDDCILVANPECTGETSKVSVRKSAKNSLLYLDCKKKAYQFNEVSRGVSFISSCRLGKCGVDTIVPAQAKHNSHDESALRSRIEEARNCSLKNDCTGPISLYPFGCSFYVNKESADLIRDLISRNPYRGEWKCKKIMGYDCTSGKCTAKDIPGEKYPGAQCVTDGDCKTIDCDRFNGPVKSGHRPECVDIINSPHPKECRCMCRGCK